MGERGERPTNLSLIAHERVVDEIRDRYVDGPNTEFVTRDVIRFFETKLAYLKTTTGNISGEDLEQIERALEKAMIGDWEDSKRLILNSCIVFLEYGEEDMDRIGIALANVANSLPNPLVKYCTYFS